MSANYLLRLPALPPRNLLRHIVTRVQELPHELGFQLCLEGVALVIVISPPGTYAL